MSQPDFIDIDETDDFFEDEGEPMPGVFFGVTQTLAKDPLLDIPTFEDHSPDLLTFVDTL